MNESFSARPSDTNDDSGVASPRDDQQTIPLALVRWFADYYLRPFSRSAVLTRLPARADLNNPLDLELALATLDFRTRLYRADLRRIDPVVMPCIAFDARNRPIVIIDISANRETATVFDPATGTSDNQKLSLLRRRISPDLLLVTPIEDRDPTPGASSPTDARKPGRHWFWAPVRANWRSWIQVMLATILINMMALALPLFIMNVYDKVIPTFSTTTLWTLTIGVCIAIGLDLLLRLIRAGILERISRRVDLKVSSRLFRQVLDLKMLDRSSGSAALASRVREYEALREFFASASFVAFVDFLFIGIFLAVLYIIVGPLAYVPMAAVVVIIGIASLAQAPLAQTATSAVDVAARRMNVLSESLGGNLTLKTLNAENAMQTEWEHAVAASSRLNGRARVWSNFTQSATLSIQQLVSVGIVVWGVYLIVAGEITVGGLIAANILAGRALAPLSMIAQTIFRGQYARKSMHALNDIMSRETDRTEKVLSSLRVRTGAVSLQNVSFSYPGSKVPAISELTLDIPQGERVALLGRVGSGKSTLGKLLAGLMQPDKGTIIVDAHGLSQYDPAELREGIGYLPQTLEFFTGTLKENLLIGRQNSSQSQIEKALYVSGLDEFVSHAPEGLNLFIGDRGSRLSGGQAQALALARLLLRQPKLIFLDEPTNAMDKEMEARVCERLKRELEADTGLILCTHRQPLADIADRYVVLEAGRKVLDGPRDTVMARLVSASRRKTGEAT